MANVTQEVEKIRSAIYGEEVRGAICSAILAMNEESSKAYSTAISSSSSASASAQAASSSASNAHTSEELALQYKNEAFRVTPAGYEELVTVTIPALQNKVNKAATVDSVDAVSKDLTDFKDTVYTKDDADEIFATKSSIASWSTWKDGIDKKIGDHSQDITLLNGQVNTINSKIKAINDDLSELKISSESWNTWKTNIGDNIHVSGSSLYTDVAYGTAGRKQTLSIGCIKEDDVYSTLLGFYRNNQIYGGIAVSTNNAAVRFGVMANAVNQNAWAEIVTGNNSSGIGVVKANGKDYAAVNASAFVEQSSRRYKENIETMYLGRANRLYDLEVVTYDYKEEYRSSDDRFGHAGMIAEDVYDLIPEAVAFDNEGQIHGLDYNAFVPYLIKTVQDLNKRIKELESK